MCWFEEHRQGQRDEGAGHNVKDAEISRLHDSISQIEGASNAEELVSYVQAHISLMVIGVREVQMSTSSFAGSRWRSIHDRAAIAVAAEALGRLPLRALADFGS